MTRDDRLGIVSGPKGEYHNLLSIRYLFDAFERSDGAKPTLAFGLVYSPQTRVFLEHRSVCA